MSTKLFLIINFCVIISYGWAQFLQKPGDCPPPVQYNICEASCYSDVECRGKMKCCSTSCGGTVCLRPVTMRTENNLQEKPGSCPAYPTGPWVCTSRCGFDGDCRGKMKCCKNRCGAMACIRPEI